MRMGLTYYYNLFLLATILVLPKIPLNASAPALQQQGILVGELILLGSLFVNMNFLFRKNVLHMPKALAIFFTFLFTYILLSSIVSGLQNNFIPVKAMAYFGRLCLYALLVISFYQVYTFRQDTRFWWKLFKFSYLVHAACVIAIFIFYNFKFNPHFGEMTWLVEVGHRVIPMVGTGFNPGGDLTFYAIGGGSGNLLGTWSVFVVIGATYLEKNAKYKAFIYLLCFFLVLMAQSRGSVLTLLIYYLYLFFSSKRLTWGLKCIAGIILLGSVAVIINLLLNKYADILPIFSRFSNAYSGGQLDGSSADRLANYAIVFEKWVTNPLYILFGMGMDKDLLKHLTTWDIVESYYLSVLFCGGIISLMLFVAFIFIVFRHYNQNIWNHILLVFLITCSLVNWSVTGGDLLSVTGLYPIIGLCTLSYLSQKEINADADITGREIFLS